MTAGSSASREAWLGTGSSPSANPARSQAGTPAACAAGPPTSAKLAWCSTARAPECSTRKVASSAFSSVGTGTTVPPSASTP